VEHGEPGGAGRAGDIAPCRSRWSIELVNRCTVGPAGLFGSGPPPRCRYAFPNRVGTSRTTDAILGTLKVLLRSVFLVHCVASLTA
jgi:hypothetical protein